MYTLCSSIHHLMDTIYQLMDTFHLLAIVNHAAVNMGVPACNFLQNF